MQKRLKSILVYTLLLLCQQNYTQQVISIEIDAGTEHKPISPFIYGKNNCTSSDPGNPLNQEDWKLLHDLGIKMVRENGGNNSTKYNWRRKLTSHPDWYNNVFPSDWAYEASSIQNNMPATQGMFGFQLIGKAARSNNHNFSSWDFNRSQWWDGVEQNLCGGGQVDSSGGQKALVDGDPDLYLEDWPADSTTGILDHWFGTGGLGLDSTRFRYWCMDNEPAVWGGKHDDILDSQPPAEAYMQSFFEIAKKARARYPGIKILGPALANEWQWYNWDNNKVEYKGQQYVVLEYFILRIAEEQQASGIGLLDVLDIHFYPTDTDPEDILQLHRVYFDRTYDYPKANGVKRSGPGGWDNSLTREYIFGRCNDWLDQYMGPGHGVTFAVTETGINGDDSNINALWYASTLGEFARKGVEIFTPWSWKTGMFEVLHLFSRYGRENFVDALSSEEEFVSTYPTIDTAADSMSIFLVNRHLSESRQVEIDLLNFDIGNGAYKMFTLADLPASETFVSHEENAIAETAVEVTDNIVRLTLAPLSVNVIFLYRTESTLLPGDLVAESEAEDGELTGVNIDSVIPGYSGQGYVSGLDDPGDELSVSIDVPERGLYKLLIRYNGPHGSKYQDLQINNASWSQVRFPATESFLDLDAGTYWFEAGENSFTVRSSWGWTDIDKFQLYPAARNGYDIAPGPVDTAAIEVTKALYDFLVGQFGKRIISGQTHSFYTSLSSLTGKAPLLRAGDFQHFTEGYPYLWVDGGHTFGKSDDGSVTALIDWYKSTGRTGVVSYQWHWHSPSGGTAGTNTFYTDYTTFDITRAVTPGTQEFQDIIRDIDDISSELKKFQDAGIPVLWRPLHEAGGGWFWWGAKGPEACKKLYNIMFDRMKNHHQLHNLLWVWSSPEESWYPGNDKVDIIGHDSYPGDYNYGPQKYSFDVLYRLTKGEKLIAMTENGPIPDPDRCFDQDAPWSYFMSWSNLVVEQNTGDHIREVFDHPQVITVGSDNAYTGNGWHSSLYPEKWKPGYKDASGRYLHDFSYAGYHMGEKEVPEVNTNVVDVTLDPYLADNTGTQDVTAIIQQALDDVGAAGGGVVFLPAGTYRIRTPEEADFGLRIRHDSTVLRGAGSEATFLFHDGTYMRQKDIILVMGDWASWFNDLGTTAYLSADLPEPTNILPVASVTGFGAGDLVVVASSPTDGFIEEHMMAGIWTASAIKGVAFLRRIDSVDAANNLLILDVPTRYFLKKRDLSRVYHAGNHISECGIEHLSIGNLENSKSGWDEETYTITGTGAYDVHFSHVIRFNHSQHCWVKNVNTYKPDDNTGDVHILSNGIQLNQSRFITVDSCSFQKPQYEGGGGNGYMYTLQSNECLIKNSRASHSRHNYDFKYPFSSGNVILNCRGEDSKYASDFHMYLSMSNLFDVFTVKGDYLESKFRPWEGDAIHGYSSTQSVFYNTYGEAYHPARDYIIESRQYQWGYIIGTSGPANNVVVDPAEGSTGGYAYNTSPRDFREGIGEGEDLRPSSLYLDQLYKRKKDSLRRYDVEILVKDEETDISLPGCQIRVLGETKRTDASGIANFTSVYSSFILDVEKDLYPALIARQVVIYSDTTLTIYLRKAEVYVTFKLLDISTGETFWGARVTFNSENGVTDTAGEVQFIADAGTYNYDIDKLYYLHETGTISVQSDTTLYFYLIRTHADIKFWLKEGTAPVDNAMVMVNGDSLVTTTLGMALFRELPVAANYHYNVMKEGYAEETGDIYLTTDTTLYIALNTNSLGIESNMDRTKIICWPNPADDFINFSIPGNYKDLSIRIRDMLGNQLKMTTVHDDFYSLDVRDLPPGMYLIEILDHEPLSIWRFTKN